MLQGQKLRKAEHTDPRWMCDRLPFWLQDAANEMGPILLGARALALLHEGAWSWLDADRI
jgi:hypothetical protein